MPLENSLSSAGPSGSTTLTPDAPRSRWRSRFGGRNLWALLDQILISGANFVTIVLVVRTLGRESAGDFTLVHSFLLLLNTLQISLIIYPLNVLGATLHGEEYRSFATSMAVEQGVLAVGLGAVVAVAAAITYKLDPPAAPLMLALVPAIIAWQLQEFVRRVLYTEDRLREAFFNDVICYGGQLALVVAAFTWGIRYPGHVMLSGEMALCIIAGTSALAAVAGAVRIRPSLRGVFDMGVWRKSWQFGRWLTASETLTYASSVHANQYIVWLAMGSSAAGGALRIVQQIFGPMRVLAYFLSNILPIRFSRTLARDGDRALHGQLIRIAAVVVPLLVGYCLLIFVIADPLLKLIYGPEFEGDGGLLRMYSIAATLGYAVMLVQAALMAHRKTRAIFMTALCSAGLTLGLGWPLAKWHGAIGGALNMILASLLMAFMLVRAYMRRRKEPSTTSEPASVMDAQEAL